MSPKAWLGTAFLVAVTATTITLIARAPGSGTLAVRLVDHLSGRTDAVSVTFPTRPDLEIGDPVYTVEGQAFALQGRVARIEGDGPTTVVCDLDPSLPGRLHDRAHAIAMAPLNDLGWVLRTLVPPDLREAILAELTTLWTTRRLDTLGALEPHLLALLSDVANVLAASLPAILERHAERRDAFFTAFRDEIFPAELLPTLKAEVFSRLEQRVSGVAATIGDEIWQQISVADLMGLLWAATKDSVGVAKEREMAERLGKILEQKALPVVRARGPEALQAVIDAVAESLNDPAVRAALGRTVTKTIAHESFRKFVSAVLGEWLLENPELLRRLDDAVRSHGLRAPLRDLYKEAEPILQKALEEVLTREDRKGMDHQLVRVLRHVVLKKDDRYVLVVDEGDAPRPRPGGPLPGTLGDDP